MGRHKKVVMDQLTIDSTNAIKAGMSYGKYMATKKPTAYEPVVVGIKHTCQHCGKEFIGYTKKVRKFCSDYCRETYYREEKKLAFEPEPTKKICPICGKEFVAESHRNKYCSEFCKKVGSGQRANEYQARKKEALS